jgi:DNA-directed RNA polymerase specialized sigma24 family protein
MYSTTQHDVEQDLSLLPLGVVANGCSQESQRFLQHTTHDPRFCYDLFRRAIVGRNQQAWERVYAQYAEETPIVRRWVERHPMFDTTGEEAAFFVNRAFEKMWGAIPPERFAAFTDLTSLMRYLKLCVNSVISDYARQVHPTEVALQESDAVPNPSAHQSRVEREELWHLIESRLNSEPERTAIYCRFDEGMKPSEIADQYPQLFANVQEVYRVLQNVLNRLRRDRELLAYFDADG